MRHLRKSLSLAVAASALSVAAPAMAQEVNIGFLGGFTGAIESLTPPIFSGAELAVEHVNNQGGVLDDQTLNLISADGACDATAASNAADRLVNSEQVLGIVGGLCTGETIGGANSAAIPGGVVMISPASTAPAVSTLEDNDLVFRTTPSDAFQGQKMAQLLLDKGIEDVAVTYVNNDYGSGLADAFTTAFEEGGGTVATSLAHEDGKADYRAELGNLASSGAQNLVVLAYANGSGQTILRQSLEAGDFTTFVGGDGMVGSDLFTGVDASMVEGMIATRAGSFEGESADVFAGLAEEADVDPSAVYAPQSYDAAFLLALAIEQNGSGEREGMSEALRAVATAPGETILPGEWEKAKELIANGEEIDYTGAGGALDFDDAGDVDGIIVELTVTDGAFEEVGVIE